MPLSDSSALYDPTTAVASFPSLHQQVIKAEATLREAQKKAAADTEANAKAIHDAIRAVVAAKVAAGVA